MIKHIRINPLFFVIVFVAYQLGSLSDFLITYLCLLLHEGIHLWFLSKHQIPVRQITVEPFGISLKTQRKMPENPMVYLSAPIGNLLLGSGFLLGHFLLKIPLYSQWILANFGLGFINLFPILPLDGGRALLLFLEKRYGKDRAKRKINLIGFILLIPAIITLTVLIIHTGGSFGMITVFIFLCYTVLSGNRLYEYQKLRKNAFRNEKGNFRDALLVEHLGVPWDYPAKKLLKEFRGEKYYVVNVFREGILLKTVTETQILNRILSTDRNLKISEC